MHRATPLPVRVWIDGANDCKYDIQGSRHNIWSSMFGLSGCRGGCPRGPRTNTLRLIDRDDLAVHVVLGLPR
ncbi:hypothetical protein GW17_00022071 [Ensete ventricosum]|nr:hypothetical protein GW17_00022071 [Ensete ventricosum]